jgi:signal transduction histidine kinase
MNEKILIVDDEQDTAELLRYNLQKASYTTVIARNGEEAIDAVQCHAPDLVLLDVMLPELNGWEVCRIMRESSKGKSIPIIMLTALSDQEARIKGLSLGADDYIIKPFSVKELLLKARRYIDRQQELKQIQVREQEQNTSLRYLVHELKNSMTVISGFSRLAIEKDDPGHYLKTIKLSAAHVNSLLDDASLLSRLEKEESVLPLETVDINAYTDEVVGLFEDTAKKRNIEILAVNRTQSPILGNRTAIRQILINLLSNAVKYNRDNGKVWIHFEERQTRVDLSVTDEGRGIAQAELPKVCDKFYRASGSEQVKGAGLGLYIVKLVARGMGGTIKAVSNRGVGSTFTVSFQKPGVRDSEDKPEESITKVAYSFQPAMR